MEKIEELIDEVINEYRQDKLLLRGFTVEDLGASVTVVYKEIDVVIEDLEQLKSSLPKPVEVPLYYVKFPNVETNGYDSWLMKMGDGTFELADNNDFESMQYTEKQIKAIDERYWAFAVPVEEEEK